MLSALQDIDEAIASVIYQADGVAAFLQDKIEGISNLPEYARTFRAFDVLMDTLKWGDDDDPSPYGTGLSYIPETTPDRIQQQKNRDATMGLIKRTILGESVKTAINIDYESRDEADAIKDRLTDAIEAQLLTAGDDGKDIDYTALWRMRVDAARALSEKAGQLPIIVRYTVPPVVLPSLVLAYDRYEDVSRELEIVERNRNITHPGFLPQGQEIELKNE
jgi:hypothetical protein